MQFKTIAFSLMILAPALSYGRSSKPQFNCENLSGTYECVGKTMGGMVMMDGRQVIYDGDSELPLIFNMNAKSAETASEKQRVVYSSVCKKDHILINSTITDLSGHITAPTKVASRIELDAKGNLSASALIAAPNSLGNSSTTCYRVIPE